MKKSIIILLILVLAMSCSHEGTEGGSVPHGENRPMMLRAMTRSETEVQSVTTDDTPVFIFWLDGYHSEFHETGAQPYFVSYPEGVIDDYSSIPYNTGYPYPGSKMVYANGYSPSDLIADQSNGRLAWTSMLVPEDLLGSLDITSTEGFVQGNASSPFDASDSQTLIFQHQQSRVNFHARLGEIPAERYFRTVRVTVNGKDIFTSRIAWNNDTKKYSAAETITEDVLWRATDPNTNQMDPNEIDPRNIGSVYLHPGQNQILFDIELEMSETATFDKYKTIKSSAKVDFIENSQNITLEAGDEYDIYITILYDSFVIKGNKAIWQDGGKIPLPFYPK